MDDGKFDLTLVAERFKNSLNQDDDVLMDFYLEAFREILKFVYLCVMIQIQKLTIRPSFVDSFN